MKAEKVLPKEECPLEEPKTLKEALRLLQEDARAKGTDKMTMAEVIEEIAASRREKKEQEQAGK